MLIHMEFSVSVESQWLYLSFKLPKEQFILIARQILRRMGSQLVELSFILMKYWQILLPSVALCFHEYSYLVVKPL